LFLTATGEIADVVLPAAAAWAEAEGTVTNSERRVQRVRKAMDPPGEAREDLWIIYELGRRMGSDWGEASAEKAWDELRSLSPVHLGVTWPRLEALGGIQWPCWDETHPGELFLHSRLWEDPVPGLRAPFVPVDHDPPVDRLTEDYPIRLTTGRRLDSYNTGVQSAGFTSPLRRGESLDISPEDAELHALADGERVRALRTRWRSAFSDFREEVQQVFAEGDRLITVSVLTGTHDGVLDSPLGPIEPTGRSVRWSRIAVRRLQGERFADGFFEQDEVGLLQQLGALASSPAGPARGRHSPLANVRGR